MTSLSGRRDSLGKVQDVQATQTTPTKGKVLREKSKSTDSITFTAEQKTMKDSSQIPKKKAFHKIDSSKSKYRVKRKNTSPDVISAIQSPTEKKIENINKKKPVFRVGDTAVPNNNFSKIETSETVIAVEESLNVSATTSPIESMINSKRDLLNRRPFAPAHLNLAVTNSDDLETSRNDVTFSKTRPSRVVKETSPTKPLISPKIIQLRRSESFHGSTQKTIAPTPSEDEFASKTNLRRINTNIYRHPSIGGLTPKSRRWALARGVIKSASILGSLPQVDKELLARLEHENSQLPPQNSAEFLLARLEKQNEMLDNDPKSVCIESNVLKANLETVQSLIDDSTSPTNDKFDIESPVSECEEEDGETPTIDWEFWTALIQDYTGVATRLPHLLTAKLQQGVPAKLRGLIWQSMCQASSTYLETMYSQLLMESSPYEKIIQRDLARTFPHIDMFKEENGEGQTMLWNVLRAYSLYDPLVGYCQGLGFLVGPLVMNMTEPQAFSVFVRLMETYDMRSMFTLNMEGLQLRLYQFSTLLSQILPKLHSHFQLHAVHAAMFASQWFLSLFAYTYPLPLVLRIYDVVFAEGAPETIMRVAIALLQKNQEHLLELGEFEDLLDFLTTKLYDAYDNKPTGLIKDAMALSTCITKPKMDELSNCYLKELEEQKKRAEELVAVRFNGSFGRSAKNDESKKNKEKSNKPKRWSLAAFPSAKQSVGSFSSLVNTSSETSSISSDSETLAPAITSPPPSATPSNAMLHQQIEDLVTALSELQKEHTDITKQLVNMKMEKIDLVTEVENLRSRIRELEKEKKRMSVTSSILSLESAIASNYDSESISSRRASVASAYSSLAPTIQSEDADVTPRQSTEVYLKHQHKIKASNKSHTLDIVNGVMVDVDQSKNRRVSAPSFMSVSRIFTSSASNSSTSSTLTVSTSPMTEMSDFDAIDLSDDHKGVTLNESKITEELIQVKMEKFELMQENDELQKRVEELQFSLHDALDAQEALQEKNVFLKQEVERLDEEAASAVYKQNSMKHEFKEFRVEAMKKVNENDNLKNQVEALQGKVKLLQDIGNAYGNGYGAHDPLSNNNADKVQERASRRVSFMSLFVGTGASVTPPPISPKQHLARTNSEPIKSLSDYGHVDGNSMCGYHEHSLVCNATECETAKRVDEMEKTLSEYKLKLAESEEARESMSSQLEGLRMLINGFAEDGAGTFLPPKSPANTLATPMHEKRASRNSIVAFFSAGGI
ncbi:hypothetical protein G9A89_017852 [Geosiphon pyriformis]|nr:hypothetical protein G9A89_017852 [Geosiphon pyriformis]